VHGCVLPGLFGGVGFESDEGGNRRGSVHDDEETLNEQPSRQSDDDVLHKYSCGEVFQDAEYRLSHSPGTTEPGGLLWFEQPNRGAELKEPKGLPSPRLMLPSPTLISRLSAA
jgi:hypothetical protein